MRRFRGFVAEWGWEEIVPSSGSEPSMNRGNALFAKDGTDLIVVGGRQENFGGTAYLSDVWRYSTSSSTWTQVIASGLTNGSNNYVSEYFLGYADGSGNIFRGPTSAGNEYFKIAKSNGAETSLGTVTHATRIQGEEMSCADISGGKIYSVTTTTQRPGATLTSFTLTTSSASSAALTTATQGTRNARSSLAYYPSGNTLYFFAPVIAGLNPDSQTWTLGTDDILKYDLTAGTGWVAESGVTNNAGSISMGISKSQLVWVADEAKFFLFSEGGQVISYDPDSKVVAQVVYSESPADEVINKGGGSVFKGNAGDVVVDGSAIYMLRKKADKNLQSTPARIWKFRRN